jgi:AraC-like DNA-binding protein
MENLLTAVILAGSLQGFFLSLIIFKKTEMNKDSRIFLVLIMIFFSINIIFNQIIRKIAYARTDFILTTGSFQFFLGPMIYFYINSLTNGTYRHRRTDIMHFIPMASYFVFMIIIHIWNRMMVFMPLINKFMWGLIIIHFTAYLAVSRKKITDFNSALKEIFSSTERLKLDWLTFLFAALLSLLILYFLMFIILLHDVNNLLFNEIFSLLLSIFIYILGYKGLQQKKPESIMNANREKYSKSLLPPDYAEYWKNKIIAFLETEKPFLDPELSLTLFASGLGIPENKLSQIINLNLDTNFYDLINKYRIDEVKKLLKNPDGKSILELAFEAGFNSKTTFNVIFKKNTGMTPTQYKNSL